MPIWAVLRFGENATDRFRLGLPTRGRYPFPPGLAVPASSKLSGDFSPSSPPSGFPAGARAPDQQLCAGQASDLQGWAKLGKSWAKFRIIAAVQVVFLGFFSASRVGQKARSDVAALLDFLKNFSIVPIQKEFCPTLKALFSAVYAGRKLNVSPKQR